MSGLKIFLLGPPRVELADSAVDIQRRKALALLVYLAVTGQPHSRDALATLFYPDHSQSRARAYLRRDLAVLNTGLTGDWLEADRETVELTGDVWVDANRFRHLLAQCHPPDDPTETFDPACLPLLQEAVTLYTDDFLAGFTLRDCPEFDDWQFFQAEGLRQELATVLELLAGGLSAQKAYEAAIPHARRWVALDPLHEPAQQRLIHLYDLAGQSSAALRQYEEYAHLVENELGLPPEEETTTLYEAIKAKRLLGSFLKAEQQRDKQKESGPARPQIAPPPPPAEARPQPAPAPALQQQIHYCRTSDGVQLAYAAVGSGPPLVKAANWLSHLEYDWQSPVWQHWLAGLAQHHTLIRYDERGCGLSEWDVQDVSLEAWVNDLEAVVDAAGLERFPLLGISQGGPIAIAYAIRHPERVSHLILYGTLFRGRLKRELTSQQIEEAQTFLQLIRVGWGQENPAFRQVFTSMFMPEATVEQQRWFNELQRVSTSPDNAVRIANSFNTIDARHLAPQVTTPTLVLHATGDTEIPFAEGQLTASLIPGARLVPLDSKNHILLAHEPAWAQFLAEVHQFLQTDSGHKPVPSRAVSTALVSAPVSGPMPPHNLPPQPTEFLGRDTELAEIQQRLAVAANCRLLTLVGPGGIGKTRLAVEAATRLLPTFPDGVYFAPLAAITEPEFIITALAEALDFNFHGAAEPKQQLFDHLKDKSLLLVLDNFEQLIGNPQPGAAPGGEMLLADLLAHAPRLRLLVTSRERLKLREEWGYEVRGMPFPAADQPAATSLTRLEEYAAGQLFVRSAARVAPGHPLTDADAESVARICQLVDGMPLGIELAAPWLRLISPAEIAAEIEGSLDFLATTLHNVPERHRSIKAVFTQSWQRLSPAEQNVLSQLSVFKGGCLRPAAEFVTGTTLPLLSELVDRALLHRTPAGRFEMHELIRQFAEEQLNSDPALAAAAHQRHSEIYMRRLRETTTDIKGAHQRRALDEIEADLENIRAAWRWAVEHHHTEALLAATECFWLFHEFRGLLHEGQALFKQTVEALRPALENEASPAAQTLLGFLQAGQGSLTGRSGNLDEGCRLMQRGIDLLQQVDPPDRQKEEFALAWLAFILVMHGRYADAKAAAETSLALFPHTGDHWSKAGCLRLLGASTLLRGQLDEAEQLLQSCVAECLEIGERRIRTYATINLGQIALHRGQIDEAKQQLERAFEITQVLGDRLSRADTLREQGRLAMTQGDYGAAEQLIQDSLALYQEIGRKDVGTALSYLGTVACVQGHHAAAEQTFHKGLDISRRVAHQADMAANLGGLGKLALARGQHHQAEQFLGEALEIWERLGNEPAMAAVLCDLGLVAAEVEADRQAEARDYWRQALELIKKHRLAPLALHLFVGLGQLLISARQARSAIELLALAEYHSASSDQTRQKARRLLADLTTTVTSEALSSSKARGQKLDWLTLADQLSQELTEAGWLAQADGASRLPIPATEFVGRAADVAEIRRLLVDDANCRLLTLVGPGGIGKTRLALEVAARASRAFPDGAYFVPLAPLGSADEIIYSLAEALDFRFYEGDTPKDQLLAYLQERQMLLYLDNFEHLLAGAQLLTDILQSAPEVKILVTSRERLNLSGETVVTVGSLEIPLTDSAKDTLAFDAAKLFLQQARLARPGFEPQAEERAAIKQVCRLTQGMPLALVLAAGWLNLLSVQEIAAELSQSLDILETEMSDVPERQRSVRAVFDSSWRYMSQNEQQAFMKLSIFRGGFTREAAQTVTGAGLPTLRALINKSLIFLSQNERYEIHELLRQYGEVELAAGGQANATRHKHSAYYLELLRRCEADLIGPKQRETLDRIEADLDNIRPAWNWAVENNQVEAISHSLESLYHFYWIRSHFQEGERVFGAALSRWQALAQKPERELEGVLLKLMSRYGAFCYALSLADRATAQLQKGLDLARRLDDKKEMAFALNFLGEVTRTQGRFAAATQLLKEGLSFGRASDDPLSMAHSLRGLGWATAEEGGDYRQAKQYYAESLTYYRAAGHQAEIASCLDKSAYSDWQLGDYVEAERLYHESLASFKAIGDQLGVAKALGGLALVLRSLGGERLVEAKSFAEESLATCRETGHKLEMCHRLLILGMVQASLGELAQSRQSFQNALELSAKIEYEIGQAYALNGLGEIAWRQKDFQQTRKDLIEALDKILPTQRFNDTAKIIINYAALLIQETAETGDSGQGEQRIEAFELLTLASNHPNTWQDTRDEAGRFLKVLEKQLPSETRAAAQARSQARSLEEAARQIVQLASGAGSTYPQPTGTRFVEESLIATGGMGQVYLGRDTHTGWPVAIKRLKPELLAHNPEVVQRFIREGETLAQLKHPNIVRMLGLIETESPPVIVMEYVEGGTLSDLLARRPQLPLAQALDIGLELADALARVHHLGIIHRDIKPGNVLLAEDGTPRLTDFGVAYLARSDMRLTKEGQILGTTVYMSPEAWRGETLDARSDIWSFGAMLFEMLAGQPPFAAANPVAVMNATLSSPLPALAQFRPDAPPALAELIGHMLVKARDRRIDSMRQVAAGLEIVRRSLAAESE